MIKIKIINDKPVQKNIVDTTMICTAKLLIHSETIDLDIPIEYWNLKTYRKQWFDGISRIRKENKSCLILSVDKQDFKAEEGECRPTPIIDMLVLYKNDNVIIVQYLGFFGPQYDKYIGINSLPTLQNYHKYIPSYSKYHSRYVNEPEVFYSINRDSVDDNISIIITDKTEEKKYGRTYVTGKLQIGRIIREIKVPIDTWCICSYEKQWSEAISRLKTEDFSCIIEQMTCKPEKILSWWLLYKHNNKIHVYVDTLDAYDYQEELGDVCLTPENCYDFVPSQEEVLEKHRIHEWKMSLDDLVNNFEIIGPK